jgi:hypothetical protein
MLVPLLAVYECGVIWLGGPNQDKIRNGVDGWIRQYLGNNGVDPLLIAPGVILALLVLWTMWRWSDRPERVFSTLFAGILWIFASNFTTILSHYGINTQPTPNNIDVSREKAAEAITYIGAGIYEEVIFRLLLCAWLARILNIALIPWVLALPMSIVISAILFSLAHNIGPTGEPFVQSKFLFRVCAGIFFAIVFWWRGFGIAVGAHAGYDIIVGLPNG